MTNRLIEAALVTLETGAILENDTDLAPWAWYAGTYQQYHTVILLLTEVYKTPNLAESDRIWSMINHVFGEYYGISKSQRCGDVLRKLKEGLESMYAMRKVRAFAESRGKKFSPNSEFGNYRSVPVTVALDVGMENQNSLNLSENHATISNSARLEVERDLSSADILGGLIQVDTEKDREHGAINHQWSSQLWVNINTLTY
jgi:hypothetical protein